MIERSIAAVGRERDDFARCFGRDPGHIVSSVENFATVLQDNGTQVSHKAYPITKCVLFGSCIAFIFDTFVLYGMAYVHGVH